MEKEKVDVLLVEDNLDDSELTLYAITSANDRLHLQHFTNGEEALKFIFDKKNYWGQSAKDQLKLIILDLKKIYFHWFGRSLIGNLYHFGDGTFWTAYFIVSVVLIALSGVALYQLHDRRLRSLLIVVFLYSTAVSALFFVQSRHRALKVDPFMVPLAVIALAGFVREPHEVKNEKISLAL